MPAKPTQEAKGASAVVVSMADASRALRRKKRGRNDPPPDQARNGLTANRKNAPPNWSANDLGLPVEDPCPVIPLGTEQVGGAIVYHLISSGGHFVTYSASDFSHAGMQALFSATPNYPAFHWPRHGKPYKVKDDDGERTIFPISTFEDDSVREALMLACERQGLFSPADKLRGRGMWLDPDTGDLIYHAGEELWRFDRVKNVPVMMDTGLHKGFLYPRFPALPAPWEAPIAAADNPVRALLVSLRGPNWTRPDIDPVLLLGWVGVAYLGGALAWRSAVLLLGGFGTGKSTLQNGLRALFGEALFHSSDTSAAGIYQNMKHDARPIAVDELEAEADTRKVDNVVHLMRQSASGAIGRRGSSGGEASQFQMRSAFLFSAINNPLHSSQDMSRVAVLRLQELTASQVQPPAIDADSCGRKVLAILMREWPRFQKTFDLYRAALKEGGHVARGQDTYGTLLAAADMLLGEALADELGIASAFTLDDPDKENSAGLAWWTEHLGADAMPEVEDAQQNWRKCVTWILTNQVEPWRNGKRATVGQCLEDLHVSELGLTDKDVTYSRSEAMRDLAATGLGLKIPGSIEGVPAGDGWILAVPNDHALLKRLFRESAWAGGGWKDALRQCPLPGVMISDKAHNKVTIGGTQQRCTLVVMGRFNAAPER